MNKYSSIYESFNARNMTPEEVANSFVVHHQFDELLGNDHALLMGPRGSGKTTMLKMLTSRALQVWNASHRSRPKLQVPFWAVYIPTDVHWHNQLNYSYEQLRHAPKLANLVSAAAVTTNILNALCSTFQDRFRYDEFVQYAPNRESQLCETLINDWKLPSIIPCCDAVSSSLYSRMNNIFLIANRLSQLPNADDRLHELPDWFFLDYLFATSVACRAYDKLFSPDPPKRWALCFDELELSPEWLQKRLMGELRSSDELLLFKLSTSPIPIFLNQTQATARNDYRTILLWSHRNASTRDFSKRLVLSLLRRQNIIVNDPEELLDSSLIAGETSGNAKADEYSQGTLTWEVIRSVAQWDEGLQKILTKHGLSINNPSTDEQSKRDQILRKVKPTAFLRQAFIKSDEVGDTSGRSRRFVSVYSGAEAVYDISDGNPRWLIGIINDLLSAARVLEKEKLKPIRRNIQARVLTQASQQFCSLIRVLPGASTTIYGQSLQLYTLLEKIGSYFSDKILHGTFPLDPKGSFIIDHWMPAEVVELLRQATYQGAIVYVDPLNHPFDSELRGKRFRLSYLLAPAWKLPLRLYEDVPLSTCLENSIVRVPKSDEDSHPKLPFG